MVRSSQNLSAPTPAEKPRSGRRRRGATKQSAIIRLLKRRRGASVSDLAAATGWQPHSVRAALTGLRKQQVTIERTADRRGNSVYRIVGGVSS